MTDYTYYYPIQIRYSDLDPQWHVNNARYLTFLEQTRIHYLMDLGLFDGEHFFDLGLIVADIHIAYLAPILNTEEIRVGMRVSHLGNKSMKINYGIENPATAELKARAEVVLVAYDYHQKRSVTIPDLVRSKIAAFEGIEPGPDPVALT